MTPPPPDREATLIELDITKTNAAVRELLERTDDRRHRFMLQAYDRHRNLEMAGRYPEIFAPEMTVEEPVYHFSLLDETLVLEGREQVEAQYHEWTETDQCIFYVEQEEIAISDHMIVSRSIMFQQTPGSVLAAAGVPAEANATYLVKTNEVMVWPYDDRCRLIGEDVWEYDTTGRDFIKLDAADVLTSEQSGALLEPLIKPLPAFDEAVLAAV